MWNIRSPPFTNSITKNNLKHKKQQTSALSPVTQKQNHQKTNAGKEQKVCEDGIATLRALCVCLCVHVYESVCVHECVYVSCVYVSCVYVSCVCMCLVCVCVLCVSVCLPLPLNLSVCMYSFSYVSLACLSIWLAVCISPISPCVSLLLFSLTFYMHTIF